MDDIFLSTSDIVAKAPAIKKEWIYSYCVPSSGNVKNGYINTYSLLHIQSMVQKRKREIENNLTMAGEKKRSAIKSLEKMESALKKLLPPDESKSLKSA